MTLGTRWLHLLIVTVLLLAAFGGASPEARAAGSTFTVTKTADDAGDCTPTPGNCSLRQALFAASAAGSGASVQFNIPISDLGFAGNVWTITLLPSTGDQLLLSGNSISVDGNSQATNVADTNAAGPEIVIDGRNVFENEGFVITGDDNRVNGLGFISFGTVQQKQVPGIEIQGDRNIVKGNYIGIDPTGEFAAGNYGPGILLAATAEENIIGGNNTNDDDFNVISGNRSDGVQVKSGDRNQIRGNFIGNDKDGEIAVPNTGHGILLDTGSNANIVGSSPTEPNLTFRNVVAGNLQYGIVVRNGSSNKVYGNRVGLNKFTNAPLPNQQGGVQITGTGGPTLPTTDNMIGGPTNDQRNIIAGNNGPGVRITGKFANANSVENNYIGISLNGLPVPGINNTVGVLLDLGAYDNTIGGADATRRNVISANAGDGVRVVGDPSIGVLARTDFNVITGNYIGTNVTGTNPIPNIESGIEIGTNAYNTRVGGFSEGESNLIAFNGEDGVFLSSGNIFDTEIQRNTIVSNTSNGVHIEGSTRTNARGNTIRYNGVNGVFANGGQYTTIAGENNETRSSITGNAADGINATGGVTLTVEFVNTARERDDTVPNGGDGADISSDSYTKILSSTIVNNGGVGVRLSGSRFSKILGLGFNARTEISQNELGGVVLTDVFSSTLGYNEISRNGSDFTVSDGLVITGTSRYITARSNNANENRGVGVRAIGTRFLYYGVTQDEENNNLYNGVIGNRGGGFQLTGVTSATLRFNRINNNYNDGVRAENGTNDVVITRNFVQLNGPQNADGGVCPSLDSFGADARTAAGQGVSIRNGAAQTRRVLLLRNLFGQNCGLAILREPNGSALTDANEGIQPPIDLGLTKLSPTTAQVFGRILIAGAGRCEGCTVELYEADPLFKPDGEGRRKLNTAEDFIRSFDEQGNFSLALNRIPAQLLATATDKYGNTSEFVAFTARYGIDIEPDRSGVGYPTQVITYYHTVTNSGNVGDTFQLSARSTNGWNYSLLPGGTFQLLPGKSLPVTVTLTLPAGSVPQVRAGLVEQTFVRVTSIFSSTFTDYVTDTTTVLPKVVISVSPLVSTAEITATSTALHAHQITNNGNITATLNLSASSLPFWPTTLSATTLTLVPGESKAVIVGVTAPNGTTAGTAAQTIINLTVPSDTSQNKVLTDTTRVVVTPRVIIRPPVANGDGAADKVTTYTDFVVINNSNGSARFRLVATSTFGAVVGFRAIGGATLDASNRFTLGVDPQANPSNALQLAVDVRLPRIIPTGAVDVVTIQVLDDATGVILGTAQARTTVRSGRTVVYLPIVRKTV